MRNKLELIKIKSKKTKPLIDNFIRTTPQLVVNPISDLLNAIIQWQYDSIIIWI